MKSMGKSEEQRDVESSSVLLNVEDYHREAKKMLPKMIYDYYSSGSDDLITLNDNEQSFRRIKLRPRILIDVSLHLRDNSINCQTEVLNGLTRIPFPCLIAPTALHRLANKQYGELATVRAAVACSTIMCVSTIASINIEKIAEEHQRQIKFNYPKSTSQIWLQLYLFNNREHSQKLIERAEKCGYKALVLTVDTCQLGNRESDARNHFSLPLGIQPENLIDCENNNLDIAHQIVPYDPALAWKDLQWIRSITSLPILIKGIIHPDDARLAVTHGVQGIIVSNHGGRQLDTCLSTIDALPDIIKAIDDQKHQMDVYLDGGIRRGTDILKAIALGAKAVLVGRPILWGLTVQGDRGVQKILQILEKEFRLAMMLSGCQTIDDIRNNNLLLNNRKNSYSYL